MLGFASKYILASFKICYAGVYTWAMERNAYFLGMINLTKGRYENKLDDLQAPSSL